MANVCAVCVFDPRAPSGRGPRIAACSPRSPACKVLAVNGMEGGPGGRGRPVSASLAPRSRGFPASSSFFSGQEGRKGKSHDVCLQSTWAGNPNQTAPDLAPGIKDLSLPPPVRIDAPAPGGPFQARPKSHERLGKTCAGGRCLPNPGGQSLAVIMTKKAFEKRDCTPHPPLSPRPSGPLSPPVLPNSWVKAN